MTEAKGESSARKSPGSQALAHGVLAAAAAAAAGAAAVTAAAAVRLPA